MKKNHVPVPLPVPVPEEIFMSLKEYSYGIIPLSKHGHQWKVLLVQHGSAKYWGFPKGHPESGETPKESAARELFEETHLTIIRFLSDTPVEEHYNYTLRGQFISKTVYLFAAEVEGELKLQEEEIGDAQWFSLEEAQRKLTYEADRSALASVKL
jgi:bis(5'-nucleosidyl)-tetraphosphatase